MRACGDGAVVNVVVYKYLVLREHEVVEPVKAIRRDIAAV